MTPRPEPPIVLKTGVDLRTARKAQKLSRKVLAVLSGLHMDTVRYWERKPRLGLRGHAVTRMLDVLGYGEWRKREVEISRLERRRGFDMGQLLAIMRDRPDPAELSTANGVFLDASARARERHGVLANAAECDQYARACVRHGVSENADKSQVIAPPLTCGAKTRAGHPCRNRAVFESGRCKNHGGMSTGPRIQEGKQRIAEAQRLRWAQYRASRQPSPESPTKSMAVPVYHTRKSNAEC
ncbi:MAG: helix-turn-helix transcriptional regulator [Paracoccaceae bacterium]